MSKVFHCFFEQSGTFKNEFKKLGYKAFDYDIKNDFNETDYVIDLFKEIGNAYENKQSIFDDIKTTDMILAFFPCIRFENQIMLWFRGQAHSQRKWDLEKKLKFDMNLLDEVSDMYKLVNKLFIVCMKKGLKLIMENPYSKEHFLRRYWCIPSTLIDKDRRERGDYFQKPTQFWFLNCEPKNNFIFEPMNYNFIECKDAIRTMTKEQYEKTGAKTKKEARSMIHPQYASRFIREFILEEVEDE